MPSKGDDLELATATALFDHLKNRSMRYTPFGLLHESGSTVDVDVIFDSGSFESQDNLGNIIVAESTRVACLKSDLPTIEKGGQITLDSVLYVVEAYLGISPYTVRLELNDG